MYKELTNLTPLTSGGQKEVYLAQHPKFGNVVFKKIFHKQDSLERTRREIRAVNLLNHPHIPKIIAHNCEETSPSFLWIIEIHVGGANLREVFKTGKTFNIQETFYFLETMLDICIRAEDVNLVHRDIKPENIMFDQNGKFWLIDFGIARHLDLKSITDSNSPFGLFTLGYASSEQFKNLKREIDIRADLFSIGVVAYEMIKGENFYILGANNDPLRVIKKLETSSLPPLNIDGDTQYLLSTFINLLGDHKRTRRPRTAKEALLILNTIKHTLKLN